MVNGRKEKGEKRKGEGRREKGEGMWGVIMFIFFCVWNDRENIFFPRGYRVY